MKAGRELDALIAEKVMGWSSQADGLYWDAGNHRTRLVLGSIIAKKRKEMGLENAQDFVFAPSTNIAAAWEVVNHLMCLGYDNKWFFQLHYDNVELWDASFYKESTSDGGGPEVWSTAGAPALAICLAALKANGVTHE